MDGPATAPLPLTRESVQRAHEVISSHVHRTPLLSSSSLSHDTGTTLLFKAENMNRSGSFKIRGAAYSVACLTDEERARGVVTQSSGNHAAALALIARDNNLAAHIVSPRTAPPAKLAAVRAYGGDLTLCDASIESREAALAEVQQRTGACYVPPSDAVNTILAQGTVFLEAEEQAKEGGWGGLGAIIAPVGGAGLLGGIAVAARGTGVRVFGAEPAGADDCVRGLADGRRLTDFTPNTIADGLLTPVGANNWPIVQQDVEKVLTVTDGEIIDAQRLLWQRLKTVVEPSGAVAFALARSQKFRDLGVEGPVCVVLSGGNVDLDAPPPWVKA
ncbi:tryptophan synthase beta subunit-like PLP-dependent enzyme [Rhodotorula diobovata]|uniref:Tryptophan synthase beta subunit-like PLP-dependent enzyme n=1 Tax=Rhodotorula diobovata TaxID=5288 RepID=A0A5C5G7J7_9BASI|nr:tryptophan synthase beta subunit-like PLP-dependent enzyme [Rhodotorula diobovata]